MGVTKLTTLFSSLALAITVLLAPQQLGQTGLGTSGGAPTNGTYITQTANGTLTNEQALSGLSTGLVKNTTGTGVLSIGVEGTDYAAASHTHTEGDLSLSDVTTANATSGRHGFLPKLSGSSSDVLLGDGTWGAGGSGGGNTTAEYWLGLADAGLPNAHDLSALGTGLVLNTGGTPSAYAGTSCTNQFPRSLNASGASTCASVNLSSDTTGTTPIGKGGTGQVTATAAFDALAPSSPSAGDLVCFDGSHWVRFARGITGQFLRTNPFAGGCDLEWATGPNIAVLASSAPNSSNTSSTFLNITAAPDPNKWVSFDCELWYQSAATTTGIAVGLFANNGTLTAAPQFFSAKFKIGGFAAGGTDATWEDHTAASLALITTTGVAAASTNYLLEIHALIRTHATATDAFIEPVFHSEVLGSTVTVLQGSYCNTLVLM